MAGGSTSVSTIRSMPGYCNGSVAPMMQPSIDAPIVLDSTSWSAFRCCSNRRALLRMLSPPSMLLPWMTLSVARCWRLVRTLGRCFMMSSAAWMAASVSASRPTTSTSASCDASNRNRFRSDENHDDPRRRRDGGPASRPTANADPEPKYDGGTCSSLATNAVAPPVAFFCCATDACCTCDINGDDDDDDASVITFWLSCLHDEAEGPVRKALGKEIMYAETTWHDEPHSSIIATTMSCRHVEDIGALVVVVVVVAVEDLCFFVVLQFMFQYDCECQYDCARLCRCMQMRFASMR
mmetsp:Transcript_14579/g.41321  ORF Transcript_14579/g.41321 Transcript_14579/m.41321 type:complete len:295 (-) Transcript_14579:49-933(-)